MLQQSGARAEISHCSLVRFGSASPGQSLPAPASSSPGPPQAPGGCWSCGQLGTGSAACSGRARERDDDRSPRSPSPGRSGVPSLAPRLVSHTHAAHTAAVSSPRGPWVNYPSPGTKCQLTENNIDRPLWDIITSQEPSRAHQPEQDSALIQRDSRTCRVRNPVVLLAKAPSLENLRARSPGWCTSHVL